MSVYDICSIFKDAWLIYEREKQVCMYLVCGSDRAALIDAGEGTGRARVRLRAERQTDGRLLAHERIGNDETAPWRRRCARDAGGFQLEVRRDGFAGRSGPCGVFRRGME